MSPEAAKGYLPLAASIIRGDYAGHSDPVSFYGDENPTEKANQEAKTEVKGVSVFRKTNKWARFDDAPSNSIAEIAIAGPLMKVGECGEPGYEAFSEWIKEADASPKISSIVLRIDSPGGSAYGVATLADAIKATSKRVIAFIDDGIAASAAYWIASAADEIVMSQSFSGVGSIGVFTTIADWYAYFEKEGLKVKDVYAPQSKDKNKDYRDALEGDEEPLKLNLSALASAFITAVKANRAEQLNLSAGDPFTGKMYMAKEAIEVGLADRVASYEQVVLGLAPSNSNQNSNSNTMVNQKSRVNAVLGIDALESTKDGVFLNEEQLEAIDAALDQSALQQRVDDLEAAESEAQQAVDAHLAVLNEQLSAAGEEPATDVSAAATRLGELVQEYGKASGAEFTKVNSQKAKEEELNDFSTQAEEINERIAQKAGAQYLES